MLDVTGLRKEFTGVRVMVEGEKIPACAYCKRHMLVYDVSAYHYVRERERKTCPALHLMCPECYMTVCLPIFPKLAGRLRALKADAEDTERLRERGWLEGANTRAASEVLAEVSV